MICFAQLLGQLQCFIRQQQVFQRVGDGFRDAIQRDELQRVWQMRAGGQPVYLSRTFLVNQAQETPMYSSTATMQFERPERVVQNEAVVDNSVRSEIDLNTYIQILQSGRLRTMVAQSLTPDDIKQLQRPYLKNLAPGANPPSVGELLGSMTPNSTRNSFLITIRVDNRDPEGAALLANRYVSQFVRYLSENVGGRNEFAVDYLRSRAKELQQEAEAAESKLQDYRRKHNLVSLDNSMNIVGERLRTRCP